MAWKKILLSGDTVETHAHLQSDITDFDHGLVSADHTVSGLTIGHVLTATGATSFAFQAPTGGASGPAFISVAKWGTD